MHFLSEESNLFTGDLNKFHFYCLFSKYWNVLWKRLFLWF